MQPHMHAQLMPIHEDMSKAGKAPLSPLVVDLDGTLTPTDTLWESVLRIIREKPSTIFKMPIWLLRGRAYFKHMVANNLTWNGENIPINEEFHDYLIQQKRFNRKIVLATAANHRIAETISQKLGLFDEVIASTASDNLKGINKLNAIHSRIGPKFSYAGDNNADLPVWAAAEGAIVVGTSRSLSKKIAHRTPLEREFVSPRADLAGWLRALRVHQWLKNFLVFVPLLTSFSLLNPVQSLLALGGFISFSLAASATYLLNDLSDLDNDRSHPTKCMRPLACGKIRIPDALAMAALLFTIAFSLAAFHPKFAVLLAGYVALTTAYTWSLKRHVIADVLVLASLYTIRIIAGAAIIGVEVSAWLLAFSGFLFFGLALVKRCAELIVLLQKGKPGSAGRNYKVDDLKVLWPLGSSSSIASVVVFGLFISAPETAARYASPKVIWLAAIGLAYWLGRLWIKTGRGEMHDDPLVFAIKDKNSLVTITMMMVAALISYFFDLHF